MRSVNGRVRLRDRDYENLLFAAQLIQEGIPGEPLLEYQKAYLIARLADALVGRKITLDRELAEAARKLGEQPSEENFKRLREVQEKFAELERR